MDAVLDSRLSGSLWTAWGITKELAVLRLGAPFLRRKTHLPIQFSLECPQDREPLSGVPKKTNGTEGLGLDQNQEITHPCSFQLNFGPHDFLLWSTPNLLLWQTNQKVQYRSAKTVLGFPVVPPGFGLFFLSQGDPFFPPPS